MGDFSSTLIAALVVLLIACVGLGIGRLVTGKNRLTKGCGYRPGDPPSKRPDESCSLCGKRKSCENKDDP